MVDCCPQAALADPMCMGDRLPRRPRHRRAGGAELLGPLGADLRGDSREHQQSENRQGSTMAPPFKHALGAADVGAGSSPSDELPWLAVQRGACDRQPLRGLSAARARACGGGGRFLLRPAFGSAGRVLGDVPHRRFPGDDRDDSHDSDNSDDSHDSDGSDDNDDSDSDSDSDSDRDSDSDSDSD
eukprot:4769245-Lingulodinium_polyedra.AAC.1